MKQWSTLHSKTRAEIETLPKGRVSLYAAFGEVSILDKVNALLDFVFDSYRKFYPDRKDPVGDLCALRLDSETKTKVIDTGICYRIAEWVCRAVPEAEIWVVWRTYISYDEEPVHCVIKYKGRYYDTTDRSGVDDWTQLRWIRRNADDYIGEDVWRNKEGVESFQSRRVSPFMESLMVVSNNLKELNAYV